MLSPDLARAWIDESKHQVKQRGLHSNAEPERKGIPSNKAQTGQHCYRTWSHIGPVGANRPLVRTLSLKEQESSEGSRAVPLAGGRGGRRGEESTESTLSQEEEKRGGGGGDRCCRPTSHEHGSG